MAVIRAKCKLCRRYGQKIQLNERCVSQKCALVRRGTKPGPHVKRQHQRQPSDYAKEFVEKQKLKFFYLLRESQLKRTFEQAMRSKVNTEEGLYALLERRLDNVVYRMGFVASKTGARQLVSHGHFTVNGKKVTTPGYLVKPNDLIGIREQSKPKPVFKNVKTHLKDYQAPTWLSVDKDKFTGTVLGAPRLAENPLPINLRSVIELYGR